MRFANDEEFLKNPTKYLRKQFEGVGDATYFLRAVMRVPLVSTNNTVDVSRYPDTFVVWIPLLAETEVMQERIDALIPQCHELLEYTVGLGLEEARVIDARTDEEYRSSHVHIGGELIYVANSCYEVWRRVDRPSYPYLFPRTVWAAGWVGMPAPVSADVVIRK